MRLFLAVILICANIASAKELMFSIESVTYTGNRYGTTTPLEINCHNLNSNISFVPHSDRLELCLDQDRIYAVGTDAAITLQAPNLNDDKYGQMSEITLINKNSLYSFQYYNNAAPFGWSYRATHNLKEMQNGFWIYQILEEGGINAFGYPVYLDSTSYILKIQ